ncbi:MAG: response regulator [Acidobacteria bacterium]|jgi:CheY-like chemotaxis protein|nr:response regulator [Acidobacteriota bacterium]
MNEKSTLLVVDDDKDLLRQLEFLLEDDFGKILISPSKEKALELAKEKIDVCLIDVRLSETDTGNTQGLEVAGELRKIHPSIIIVMMSRYDFEKYESLTQKESQADAFIRKPFIMDDFVQLVNKIKEARNAGTTSH